MSRSTENAPLPHGGGTNQTLTSSALILFDIGGTLHGYYSDQTCTFALRDSRIPTQALEKWFLVQTVQQVAARATKEGPLARDIDAAARDVIAGEGLGKLFTHRFGHSKWCDISKLLPELVLTGYSGIGLQMHEAPYLRGGNSVRPSIRNAFSNEPGIYIPSEVGFPSVAYKALSDT